MTERDRRMELQDIFIDILGTRGQELSRVYFQPGPKVTLKYPCIIYARNDIATRYADNLPYNHKVEYIVTIVDADPDSEIPFEIGKLPSAAYERHYTADNLNHDVYTIYY